MGIRLIDQLVERELEEDLPQINHELMREPEH